MGRNLTSNSTLQISAKLNGLVSTSQQIAGFMGVFGVGRWIVYNKSGIFTVPSGVKNIRVRVVGGGGSALSSSFGGAGGGYAHGVFTVNPGETFTVTVGSGGTAPTPFVAGGTSSFGSLISATGGGISLPTGSSPAPGIGIGGDFQAKGGTSVLYGGGGAAGSQLGDGGSGLCEQGGGGGVGGNDALGFGGASAFGSSFKPLIYENVNTYNYDVHSGNNWRNGAPDITGKITVFSGVVETVSGESLYRTEGSENTLQAPIRFPFDGFTGGGGCMVVQNTNSTPTAANVLGTGGNGAGGGGAGGRGGGTTIKAGDGGVGGGGGASYGPVSVTISGGFGGIGAGSGSSNTISGLTTSGTNGGQGIVIVEW